MSYMKQPCKHCPFRSDVKPFLHPDRAAEFANAVTNPYATFSCHKTTEPDEDSEDGNMMVTEDTLECAGFLTLRAQEGEDMIPEGFKPAWGLCYLDRYDMMQAYEDEWGKRFKTK